MNNQDFAKLQKIGEEECQLPDTFEKIMVKNNILPSLVQKWQTLYTKQNFIVQKAKIDLEELYGQLFKHYKFDDNYSWGSTKEIESQIYADPNYVQKLRDYTDQKYYLEYIIETLGTIKGLSFTIKNYIEYKKMMTSIL